MQTFCLMRRNCWAFNVFFLSVFQLSKLIITQLHRGVASLLCCALCLSYILAQGFFFRSEFHKDHAMWLYGVLQGDTVPCRYCIWEAALGFISALACRGHFMNLG